MMAYVPNRGDIVYLNFDPSSGQQIQGPHFGLVLSGKVFNRQGLALVCPISQGSVAAARNYGTVVKLMGGGPGRPECCALPSIEVAGMARAQSAP